MLASHTIDSASPRAIAALVPLVNKRARMPTSCSAAFSPVVGAGDGMVEF